MRTQTKEIQAALSPQRELGRLTGLLSKIRPAIELPEKSGELAMITEGQLGIVGAMYSVQGGPFSSKICSA